jgi:hypothetical protein
MIILVWVALFSFLPSISSTVRNFVINEWPLSTTWEQNSDTNEGEGVPLEEIIGVEEQETTTWVTVTWLNQQVPTNTWQIDTWEWKSEWISVWGIVTYAKLFQALDTQWVLPAITEQPNFTLITRSSPLYQSFQRAWWLNLVGTNINPDRQVRCENLMVVLWIIQERKVTAWNDILWAYRRAAEEKNALWNCSDPNAVANDIVLN